MTHISLFGQTKQTLRETGPEPALRQSIHTTPKRRMEIRAALLTCVLSACHHSGISPGSLLVWARGIWTSGTSSSNCKICSFIQLPDTSAGAPALKSRRLRPCQCTHAETDTNWVVLKINRPSASCLQQLGHWEVKTLQELSAE